MSECVCPWWLGYLLASPLRRLVEADPGGVLAPYVREGMIVLEPGPGMGFFTIELARRVGPAGRVVAVDIQRKMLDGLKRRAAKAGLLERVDARLAQPGSMGVADLSGTADFVLAYAMVHEIPAPGPFFAEVSQALKPGGRVLLVEPAGHVDGAKFETELALAAEAGLKVTDRPVIRRSRAAVLTKAFNS
jgi:SAM-dependent methyltransferase